MVLNPKLFDGVPNRYADKYGNPVSNPLQAHNYTPPPGGGGGSEPSAEQVNSFEQDAPAQDLDDRRRDAEMNLRDKYRED